MWRFGSILLRQSKNVQDVDLILDKFERFVHLHEDFLFLSQLIATCMPKLYKKLWYEKLNIKYIRLPLTEINWLQNLKKKQIHKVSYILANMVVKINNFKNVALKSFWETGKQKEVFDPKQRLWGSRTGSLDWNSLNLLPKKGVIRYKSH